MKLNSVGITDVGCRRENNEDALSVRDDILLFVVADGVGGAAAGEVASDLFVKSCEHEFETYNGWSEDYGPLISRCFINANQNILDHTKQHPETRGMGCTAELLTFYDNEYYIGHVGDSRTYLLRDRELSQVTKDHSYIQEQIDLGLVNKQEAETHWLRNAIYRAVGHIEDIEVDIVKGKAKENDVFLLCSDGLTDMVQDTRIQELMNRELPVQSRAELLVEEAKKNGGRDNITVLLCQVVKLSSNPFLASVKNKIFGK